MKEFDFNHEYDALIVGCGLYGITFARMCKDAGLDVAIVEKRSHIGGTAYDYKDSKTGIIVQKYGAHIFRTSNEKVWSFVNEYSTFKSYIHEVKARYKGAYYSLPFNLNTWDELYGCKTSEEAKKVLNARIGEYAKVSPKNLEEQALKLAGKEVYEIFIKGYSEKQWGRPCTELPADTMRRIKFRFERNNDYFSEKYEGIPSNGFTAMFEKMLEDIPVYLNYDFSFFANKIPRYKKLIYTGRIDDYYLGTYGNLEFRTVKFLDILFDEESFQPTSVTNYTDADIPYTRTIEHKKFLNQKCDKTIISFEYPKVFEDGDDPFYAVHTEKNIELYNKYRKLADEESNVLFGGTLGKYQYNDMNETILNAMKDSEKFIKEFKND